MVGPRAGISRRLVARQVAEPVVVEGRVGGPPLDEARQRGGHEVSGHQVSVVGEEGDGAGCVARSGHDAGHDAGLDTEVRHVGLATDEHIRFERLGGFAHHRGAGEEPPEQPDGQVRLTDPARLVDAEVGDVAGDRCAGESAEFCSRAEVVEVSMGDDDQADFLGVHAEGGDLVVNQPAAAGCSGVDDDRLPARQQRGMDGVPTGHGNGNDLGRRH